jgi:Lsr2
MAQKVLVQLVDDLDGTSSQDVSTVLFGLDGVSYEIDLSDANAERLRDGLQEFVDSARRTVVGSSVASARSSPASRPARARPGRSASGPRRTGSSSPVAAVSHRTWSRHTRRPRPSPSQPRPHRNGGPEQRKFDECNLPKRGQRSVSTAVSGTSAEVRG